MHENKASQEAETNVYSLTNVPWHGSYGDTQSFEGQFLNKSHTRLLSDNLNKKTNPQRANVERKEFGEEVVNPFDIHHLLLCVLPSLT